MKRILTLALSLTTLAALAAGSTNAPAGPTYTNGVSLRLPLNDAQFGALVYLRRTTGQTNVPFGQMATNYAAVSLTGQAQALLQARRAAIAMKLSNATDAQLSQIEADLQ